ncbi:Mei-P26 [Strongyloides ratti]|uniref:Mei-P26 n=1 Tax=Strongyloides ratti TaxID=34506 RepID=A0A090LGG7_STRRB|nr:Mei-P26 [Strongyloides ratti]CEF67193.1 Mei-P26 [Strongyloides ratti]
MADTTGLMHSPIDFCTKDVGNLSTPSITDSNDGLLCRICEKIKYSPRLLSCLHSFCTDCIIKLQKNGNDLSNKKNNENYSMCNNFCNYLTVSDAPDSDKENNWKSNGCIRCPICFQLTTLDDLSIDEVLPFDYPIIQHLDKSKHVPNSEICKICNKGDKAIAACESCKHICEQCVTMHKHVSVFQNHKVKLLSEISPNGGAPSKRDSLDCECGQKKVTYFCDDCEVFICNSCFGKHNNHAINESSTWNSVGLCNQFEDVLKLIGKESVNAESLLSNEAEMKACDEYFAIGIGKIEFIHERLVDALNNWKNDMINDLEHRKNGLKDQFGKLRYNWTVLNGKEVHMVDFVKNLVSPNLDKELWKLKKSIFEQANYLINEYKKLDKDTKVETPLQSTEHLKTSIHNYLTKCLILIWNSFSSEVEDNVKHHISNTNYPLNQIPVNIHEQNSYNNTAFDFNIHYSNNTAREYRPHGMQYNNGSGDCEYDGNTSDIIPSSSTYGENYCDNYNNKNVRNSDLPSSQNVEGNNYVRNVQDRSKDFSWTQYNTNAPVFTPTSNNNQKLNMNNIVPYVGCPNGSFAENSPVSPCHNPIYSINNDNNSSPNNSIPDIDTPLYSLNPMSPTYNKKFNFSTGSSSMPPPSSLIMTTSNNGKTCKGKEMSLRYSAGLFGNPPEQLNAPHGLSIGRDEDVVVCDTNNHRIVIFSAKMQHFVFGSGGCEEGLLYYPKKIVTFQFRGNWMHIILDRGAPSRLQMFSYDGMFKCRFNSGIGNDNINAMSFDEEKETLIIIDNKGIITGFGVDSIPEAHRRLVINCGRHIREPSDVIYHKGYYYVSDYKAHNVCVFDNQANLIKRFGNSSITPYPVGLSITQNDIILVGDSHGNRYHISGFNIDGILVTEHECPDVKVSRCVGLKVGSDGNIITVSKQNNLVLVFNPLQNITTPISTATLSNSSSNATTRFHI